MWTGERYYDPAFARHLTRETYRETENAAWAINPYIADPNPLGHTLGNVLAGVAGSILGGPGGSAVAVGAWESLYGYALGEPVSVALEQGVIAGVTDFAAGKAFAAGSAIIGAGVRKAVGKAAEGVSEGLISRAARRLIGDGCFVAGTPIAMADGSFKTIEQVRSGDRVLSRNPQASTNTQCEAKTVVRSFVHIHPATLLLRFADGESIETTDEHPFYVDGEGFVPAGRLSLGRTIVTRAGPPTLLVSVTKQNSPKTVYNLEVQDDHTYFVGNNGGGLWVHNDCGDIALGLNPYYKELAQQTSSSTWRDWVKDGIVNQPTSKRFGRLFLKAGRRANRIHFTLDGIEDVDEAFRLGARGFIDNNFTNAELYHVLTNPKLRTKVIFYRNGVKINL